MVNPALAAGLVPARIAGMTRKRGRRSTRPDMEKLVAEIRETRLKWDALPLEEKLRIPVSHSTPGPFKPPVPDGPFAAWVRFQPRTATTSGALAAWAGFPAQH
jgi:hypothetical protein